jgi:4-amino-4-deoxy-L-arabinose transferase-like glycosyltransferase
MKKQNQSAGKNLIGGIKIKISNKAVKYFQYFFFGILVLVFIMGIARFMNMLNDFKFNIFLNVAIVIGVLAVLAVGVKFYQFLQNKYADISRKRANITLLILSVAVLILQIFCSYMVKTDYPLPTDLRILDKSAQLFCENFDPESLRTEFTLTNIHDYTFTQNLWEYFQYYPINIPLLYLLSFCYKLHISPILLNTLFLFGTYLLTCFTARKVYSDNFKPLAIAVFSSIFSLFYSYTTIYYTDTMSIFWMILGIYLAICALKAKRKTYVFWIFSALSLSIGFMIKGTVGIILPAVLIYLILKIKELGWKKVTACGVTFLFCFLLFVKCFNVAVDKGGLHTEESKITYEYPKTHWVMMGLGGHGGYSGDDNAATRAAGNYDEKSAFDNAAIKERITNYTPIEFVVFLLYHKAARTWLDGTYFINQGYLENDFFNSKIFEVLAETEQFFLYIALALSFFFGAKREERDFTLLFRIALCGIFIFLLIWETRSRYIINFTPLLLLLLPSLEFFPYASKPIGSNKIRKIQF